MLNTWQISISTFSNAHWIIKFSVRHRNNKKNKPIKVYKDFRRNGNRFRGVLMLYVNESISCKPITDHPVFSDLELMSFELHQSKLKWLLSGIDKSPSQNDIEFLNRMSLIIDYYLQTNLWKYFGNRWL